MTQNRLGDTEGIGTHSQIIIENKRMQFDNT